MAEMIVRLLQTYLSLLIFANLVIGRQPACLFQKPEKMGWQSCDKLLSQGTDLCCAIGSYPFRKWNYVTTVTGDGPAGTSEITFNFSSHLVNVKDIFVLDRAETCNIRSECYVLDPDSTFYAQLPVQFKLTWDRPLRVLHANEIHYNSWVRDRNSKECQTFQASNITIDQDGSDLLLRILPPVDKFLTPANISSVCLHIYSAKNINNFTCSEDVEPRGEFRRDFCIDNPYGNETVLRVENATHFFNGTHELKLQCAQGNIGAYCYVLSKLTIQPPGVINPPPKSFYLPTFFNPLFWAVTIIICLLLVFAFLMYLLRHPRKQRGPLPVRSEQPLIERQLFRGVILYCKEENEHLQSIVDILIEVISRDNQVMLLDPYQNPEVVTRSPAEYAHFLLTDPGINVLFLHTDRVLTIRETPNHVFDLFYIAASRIVEENPVSFGTRILDITMRAGLPQFHRNVERQYLLPHRIENLLNDIPGVIEGDRLNEIGNTLELLGQQIINYNTPA